MYILLLFAPSFVSETLVFLIKTHPKIVKIRTLYWSVTNKF
jgi:hypothetical protein